MLLPLAVDLDGTLIHDDVTDYSFYQFLRRFPLQSYKILWWMLTKGPSYTKRRLAAAIPLDPSQLLYHQDVLNFLRQEQAKGREIVLATASDLIYALQVANYVGLFRKVFASDGDVNLKAQAKAERLVKEYGREQFVYAGNSADDLAVWAVSATPIAVNTPPEVFKKLQAMGKPVTVYEGVYTLPERNEKNKS